MDATYHVSGMTCEHCASAVTEELMKMPGVRTVSVDVSNGLVHIDSEAPLDRDSLRTAVDEAGGYALRV
jgi:copper chaperone